MRHDFLKTMKLFYLPKYNEVRVLEFLTRTGPNVRTKGILDALESLVNPT